MLSYSQFLFLRDILEENNPVANTRQTKSAKEISDLREEFINKGLVKEALFSEGSNENTVILTKKGLKALEPFKVDNAIILAAGLSRRFAPLSYETPKGLVNVKGEILIERQIRQLQEVGIEDITVVVGYKQEQFFYLEDDFGVHIALNPDFASKNNHSSLWVVQDKLANTYICSSDIYNIQNPFHGYEFEAYYSAQYAEKKTDEWIIEADKDTPDGKNIEAVSIGGENGWYMVGHAYFDKAFSDTFRTILKKEINLPQTSGKLWENLFIEHLSQLSMVVRPYTEKVMLEFDSLDDLLKFDPFFLENVDSTAINNIVETLGCERTEIHDVFPMKDSLTNLSCHFSTNAGEYVYRHPGNGTEHIINRHSELAALKAAKKAGFDSTFIKANADEGWKISHYVKNARTLDPHKDSDLRQAMEICRKLHESGVTLESTFNFFTESEHYLQVLEEANFPLSKEIEKWHEIADKLNQEMEKDNAPITITHNDFYSLNFLISEDGSFNLIDWEYAGMGDYANDFATFSVTCDLSDKEIDKALDYYFKGHLTQAEKNHNLAMIGLCGWCWYLWSLVKELSQQFIGETQYLYYKFAKRYLKKAADLYDI